MITTILRTADEWLITAAQGYTADHLHVPIASVPRYVAVAYVIRHFRQGDYEGWDGFAEMLETDRGAGE